MRRHAVGTGWKTAAIETPGADYPPSEEFTEDLENEDIPPEKLPKPGGRRRARARRGWEDVEEEQSEKNQKAE